MPDDADVNVKLTVHYEDEGECGILEETEVNIDKISCVKDYPEGITDEEYASNSLDIHIYYFLNSEIIEENKKTN